MDNNNRPRGREKNVTGQGKDIYKRGEGLGTGPVGDTSGRPGTSSAGSSGGSTRSSGTRGLSISNPIVIIVIIAVLIFGGGGGVLSSLLGGGDSSGDTGSIISDFIGGGQDSSGQSGTSDPSESSSGGSDASSAGTSLSNVLGGLNSGSVSTGWAQNANTGKLNTSVASGSRAKYTTVKGGGRDTFTIMVYMCGTDLESKSSMATSDLVEMTKATLSDKINIIVYTGGCKKWNNNIISSSVNQIYKVENGGLRCLVDNDGNAAMTNPSTLSKFIKFCNKNYPADRMALIFWDHGGGSVSGYGYDEKYASSGSMNLKGINQALKDGGIKYDFIGFDACLMATAETGLMLSDYADYLIASEETEPGVGWYYTDWLTALSKNTSMATVEIGKNICDSFVAECGRTCAGQKTTLSVVDLAELEHTVPAQLKSFAASTSKLLDSNNYATVSDARTGAREFASSSKIDQVDLVHLCLNMGTKEGQNLANAILGAVKYNVTSSNMTNAYGVSIYFPYQRMSQVDSAVATMDAIGMDSEYAQCIQKFAGMETGGQAISGGASSPLSGLLGSYASAGTSAQNSDMVSSILNGLLGGDTNGVSGLSGIASAFLGKGLDVNKAAPYLNQNRFDSSALTWNEQKLLVLPERQWALINDLELNVFYDDGKGYIDLGLDNVFEFTDSGALKGQYDGTWLAINNQPVPYYHIDTLDDGTNYTITGRVPCFINGDRADLILVFDNAHPHGYVAGARYDYRQGETDTVAKSMTGLKDGDVIDFVCDYYSYDGVYQDSYLYGDKLTVKGELKISDVYVNASKAKATYRFTDIYGQTYWTSVIS